MSLSPDQFDGFEYKGARILSQRTQGKKVTARLVPIDRGGDKPDLLTSPNKKAAQHLVDIALHPKFGAQTTPEGSLRFPEGHYEAWRDSADSMSESMAKKGTPLDEAVSKMMSPQEHAARRAQFEKQSAEQTAERDRQDQVRKENPYNPLKWV